MLMISTTLLPGKNIECKAPPPSYFETPCFVCLGKGLKRGCLFCLIQIRIRGCSSIVRRNAASRLLLLAVARQGTENSINN